MVNEIVIPYENRLYTRRLPAFTRPQPTQGESTTGRQLLNLNSKERKNQSIIMQVNEIAHLFPYLVQKTFTRPSQGYLRRLPS
ncbi:cathepsin O [Corchorus olitorius]|uniref:Cathepsin O n=1 Tax=Corchorus olitorius TaxID=93759 RepID=A0A1R3KZI5_9ROSI|nr:cathepsin O [Corchorus olitorius]